MQMTREGNVAYSTPVYCGTAWNVFHACSHSFKSAFESEKAPGHPDITMTLQICFDCGATRVKCVGPVDSLKKAIGEE